MTPLYTSALGSLYQGHALDALRRLLGIDLNPDYCALALRRIRVHEPRLTDMLLEAPHAS